MFVCMNNNRNVNANRSDCPPCRLQHTTHIWWHLFRCVCYELALFLQMFLVFGRVSFSPNAESLFLHQPNLLQLFAFAGTPKPICIAVGAMPLDCKTLSISSFILKPDFNTSVYYKSIYRCVDVSERWVVN